MKLPKLYKKTSLGQTQYWEIEYSGHVILEHYGKIGGKEITSGDTIRKGKSIGKSNETTPAQQAELEAKAKWEGKIKKGYVQEVNRAESGETNHDGGWFPMLAQKYSERAQYVQYPAYVQPKLDGFRCVSDRAGKLWTRTRKPYVSVPHIEKAIKSSELLKDGGIQLDGELYNHKYKSDFEKISHLVNQKTSPAEGHEIVEYHIYDMNPEGSWTFADRIELLQKINLKSPLVLVETLKVNNEDELMEAFEHFLAEGYEGAMVRNADGIYVGKRSNDLQKIKEFQDSEFKVVGIEEGRGRLQGHVGAFICVTKNGTEFKAKMTGDTARLKEYFENHKLWKGKTLTVKYQNLTGANKVPRFGVGLRFREDV